MASFTAAKMMWVKKHEPENFKRCRHILLPKDYIRFMLTGVFATDVSDASGMQLLDVGKRCWSDEVLKKLEIDEDLLAKVYESPEVTGYGKTYPTNSFALLTGNEIIPTKIQCGVFKGDNRAIFVDRREFTGPIQNQIEEAYKYVLSKINLGAEIEGLYRQDMYELPSRVWAFLP